MAEWKLFEGDPPEWTTPEWYAGRERAPHLEQGVHRGRLETAADFVVMALGLGADIVVDLGAGDGGLLQLLTKERALYGTDMVGFDLQMTNVEAARHERDVDVRLHDVVADTPGRETTRPACGVMTEFLEHLVDPHLFLATLPGCYQWLVASSPAFETASSHYAFHTWAWDTMGYRALFEGAGFDVLRHEVAGEFQVLLAAAP